MSGSTFCLSTEDCIFLLDWVEIPKMPPQNTESRPLRNRTELSSWRGSWFPGYLSTVLYHNWAVFQPCSYEKENQVWRLRCQDIFFPALWQLHCVKGPNHLCSCDDTSPSINLGKCYFSPHESVVIINQFMFSMTCESLKSLGGCHHLSWSFLIMTPPPAAASWSWEENDFGTDSSFILYPWNVSPCFFSELISFPLQLQHIASASKCCLIIKHPFVSS